MHTRDSDDKLKPKQRKPQRQSSRLYLRNADHREAIFNDMYHNALWANTDKVNDKLVWAKYPNSSIIYNANGSGDHGGGIGYVDLDRQFAFGVAYGGGQRGRPWIWQFEEADTPFILAYTYYSKWECAISEDGVVWKRIPNFSGATVSASSIWKIGKDGLCGFWGADYWHTGDTNKYCFIIRFSKDEETGEWSASERTYTIPQDYMVWSSQLFCMGTTENGVLVTKEEQSAEYRQWYRYHMDLEGNITVLSDPVPPRTVLWANYSNGGYCKVGNRHFFALMNRRRKFTNQDPYADQYQNTLVALVSMDNGRTWLQTSIFGYVNGYYNSGISGMVEYGYNSVARIQIFARDGVVYILTGQTAYSAEDGSHQYDVRMFSSLTGTSWDEIPLPKWLDLNMITERSGTNISPSGSDTYRVYVHDIDPSVLVNYGQNCLMYHLGNTINNRVNYMDRGHYNIKLTNGRLNDPVNEDFYMCIGDAGLHMYFDNKYMAENAQSFAWWEKVFDYNDQMPDTIQNGDYCVPYDPVPFDPSPYPFWDYYIWVAGTQEYVKVSRITLPYYSEYYLVVVEYLPQVGANNVLYKVPRYNV